MSEPQIQIIYEDPHLLVLNKPAGWVVDNVREWISKNLKFEIATSYEFRNGLVHRLDKETSGCLLIAKNEEVFIKLQEQFKTRQVHKTYMALSHGEFERKSGEVDAKVGRLPRGGKFGIIDNGREAVTAFKVLETLVKNNDKFSLVELKPLTGRTHQIRIHLKHIHHPIVADPLYAGRKTIKKDREWCPRLFLHASEIQFVHPITGKVLEIEAPMPHDLETVLQSFSR